MENDSERYGCQVKLPGFGEKAQKKLQQAKVLVAGAGGLGCPAAQYLAAAGIGLLGIADFDVVSTSNLHRQILYTPADAGEKKAIVACNKLQQQNPQIQTVPYTDKITEYNVQQLLHDYDIIIDCTDNFDTRYLLNDACVLSGKPLVYGAIYQYEGQAAVWNITNRDGTLSPNYRDIFPDINAAQIPDCNDGGVIPTLAGIIGCILANETMKLITGIGEPLAGKMMVVDALTMQTRIIKTGATTTTVINNLHKTALSSAISYEVLHDMIQNNFVLLIDVRTPNEHAAFNIGGMNIPIEELGEQTKSLAEGKKLIFYCTSGKRSQQAVKLMQHIMPDIITYSLEGGINATAQV